jgi:hypothetical protein
MSEAMKTYTIRAAAGEPGWAAVPRLETGCVLWLPDAGIRAFGQFCHDAEYLYVHLRAVERDIRAEYTAPLSPVCEDSCLEFFFMPEGEDRYLNFEVNPNGCLLAGFGRGRADRVFLHREDLRELFGIRTARTPDGWEVFYRIPLDYIRLFYPDYQFKGKLAANFYKCGNKTVNRHYLSWSPVLLESPDFHCPEYFGVIEFEP